MRRSGTIRFDSIRGDVRDVRKSTMMVGRMIDCCCREMTGWWNSVVSCHCFWTLHYHFDRLQQKKSGKSGTETTYKHDGTACDDGHQFLDDAEGELKHIVAVAVDVDVVPQVDAAAGARPVDGLYGRLSRP